MRKFQKMIKGMNRAQRAEKNKRKREKNVCVCVYANMNHQMGTHRIHKMHCVLTVGCTLKNIMYNILYITYIHHHICSIEKCIRWYDIILFKWMGISTNTVSLVSYYMYMLWNQKRKMCVLRIWHKQTKRKMVNDRRHGLLPLLLLMLVARWFNREREREKTATMCTLYTK